MGSEQGGRTAAILFSFTSTCQRLGVVPWAYLRAVLERSPSALPEDYSTLLPDRWPAARAAEQGASSVASKSGQSDSGENPSS